MIHLAYLLITIALIEIASVRLELTVDIFNRSLICLDRGWKDGRFYFWLFGFERMTELCRFLHGLTDGDTEFLSVPTIL